MKRYLRKPLKEELSNDDIYDVIYDVIDENSSIRDDVIEIAKDIIDRVDDYSDEDDIYYSLDEGLIYDADQWTILRYYSDSIASADWDSAFGSFYDDLIKICNKLEELKEEDYEEEEEEE